MLERHNAILQSQNNANNPNPFFQDSDLLSQQSPNIPDQDLSDRHKFNRNVPAYKSEDNDSDNNIQYLETQARFKSPIFLSNFSESNPILDSEIGESNLDHLVDIDKLLSQQMSPPFALLS